MPSHVVLQLEPGFLCSVEDREKFEVISSTLVERFGIEHITFCFGTREINFDLESVAAEIASRNSFAVRIIRGSRTKVISPSGHSTLTLAHDYFGRAEILDAIKRYVRENAEREPIQPLTQEIFKSYLACPALPYPDLIILTGGERSLPDNLIWQMAYAEFWTTPKQWSTLEISDLAEALRSYQLRERRFGQVLQHAS